MPVGIRVALDAQQRTLSLLEPAVQPRTHLGGIAVAVLADHPIPPGYLPEASRAALGTQSLR
jgi:hypothetical protein